MFLKFFKLSNDQRDYKIYFNNLLIILFV